MPQISIGGHQLHYEWRGEFDPARDAVVFLHHGLGAVGSWNELPERIGEATGLNALVYDRLGHGRSDPRPEFPFGFMESEMPVLLVLLDQLQVRRVHLVGHSDGGSIALLLAGRHPARVLSLVTEAAHTFVEPKTQEAIRALLAEQEAGNTPGWLMELHGERADDLLRNWGKGWLSEAHARWQIEDWLGYVTCPTLVIQGEADEFGTLAQLQSIANRVGGSTSWILPGCGHAPHTHDPEAFVDRVVAHIRAHGGQGEPDRAE